MEIPEIEALILDGILPDQQRAIEHVTSHARLLAGPGTGKTQ